MSLSSDLISQFVKATKETKPKTTESTVYGTTVEYDGRTWVRLDGSDLLTPVTKTTNVKDGDRVSVNIKDHTATITGNISSPSASTGEVEKIGSKITEFEIVMAYKVTTDELEAINATIENLRAKAATFENMDAINADIETLQAKFAELEYVSADAAKILNADIENLRVKFGEFTDISTEDLEAINADINQLKAYTADFVYVSADSLEALRAKIGDLDVNKLSASEAMLKYATIDFANIGQAAFEYFYSKSGLIEDVIVGDGTITGNLVGVTIKGDVIEGGTVVADKLVIKGENGLYYKLNTDGVTTEAEQTEYNSINGSIITAKSITATQISVSDLVAFDATIGGFNITSDSIYSEVKDSEGNTTRGIYFDTDGQVNIGDSNNYIRYLKNDDGTYSLAISAESVLYALNGTQRSLADFAGLAEYITMSVYEGEPCIELGKIGSDFKLRITNTQIQFIEGNVVPAYINNQKLMIEKAEVVEELKQGGFIWKTHGNGNLGLMWIGE